MGLASSTDQSGVPGNVTIENRFEIMSPSGMALLGSRKQSLVAKARGYILRSCYVHADDKRHSRCGLLGEEKTERLEEREKSKNDERGVFNNAVKKF